MTLKECVVVVGETEFRKAEIVFANQAGMRCVPAPAAKRSSPLW